MKRLKMILTSFLKLYKLAKEKVWVVSKLLIFLQLLIMIYQLLKSDLKRLRNDVSMLQSQKHTCKRNLYQLNNQIATTSRLLNSFRISCERERREIENLCNEKARLEAIVTEFKNNNEEYLENQTGS